VRTFWLRGRELANKLAAYRLVRLRGPGPRVRYGDRWADLVTEVYRREPFAALFRLERVGRDLTQETLGRRGLPSGLLRTAEVAALPESCLLMLHAGMGLAFAERTMGALPRGAVERDVAAALATFATLCADNALPGYAQPAWEPLGLIVRLFHPHRLAAVAGALAGYDAEPRLCFWHGVGRGLYFLPRYFRPGATRRAVARCRREPLALAGDEARTDALAGFVFAATMVNLRHPPVLEAVVATLGDAAAEEPVVAGAVAACVLTRRHTTPHDPAIPALLEHRPRAPHAELWRRRVHEPVATALQVHYPALVAAGRLPQLLRHRDLAAIAGGVVAEGRR